MRLPLSARPWIKAGAKKTCCWQYSPFLRSSAFSRKTRSYFFLARCCRMFLEFSRNLSKCFFRWAYIPFAILQTQRPSFVVSFRPGSNCCSRDLIESGKVGSASESAHCPFVPAAVAWETQRFICGYVLHASCSNVDQAKESFDSLQRQKPNQRGNSKHCLEYFFCFFILKIHLFCALSNFTNPSSHCRATWKLCRIWIEVQPLL